MDDCEFNLQQLSIRVISSHVWVTTDMKEMLFNDKESVYTQLETRVRLSKFLNDFGVPKKLAVMFREDALAVGEVLRHLFCEKFCVSDNAKLRQKLENMLSKMNVNFSAHDFLNNPIVGHLLVNVPNLSRHFALHPSGYMKVHDVVTGVIQHMNLEEWKKYLLARHYFVFDSNTADSLAGYFEMLKNALPSKFLKLLLSVFKFAEDMHVAFETGNVWAAEYFKDTFSRSGILPREFPAVTRVRFDSPTFCPKQLAVIHIAIQQEPDNAILQRYFFDSFKDSSKSQEIPFWTCCFCDDLLAKLFLQLDTNMFAYVSEIFRHIGILCHRMISYNENHLFQHIRDIWHRRSDSEKSSFIHSDGMLTKNELFHCGYNNIEYTTRCLLLFQSEGLKFKHNENIDFVLKCIRHLIKWNESFSLLDEYLESFIFPKSKIQALKRSVVDSLDGQYLLREFFCENLETGYEQGKKLLRWLLETSTNVEIEECIKTVMHNAETKQDENMVQWMPAEDGCLGPGKAVVGGYDINGEFIYVGRAKYNGEIIPGKIVSSHHTCYVSKNAKEISRRCYEVLCTRLTSKLDWIALSSSGKIPKNAIVGGNTCNGNKLYIGRTLLQHGDWLQGTLVCGKVDPIRMHLSVPFDCVERTLQNYQILCLINSNENCQ